MTAREKTTYTSEIFKNSAFAAQTITVDNIPTLAHEWGDPAYEWATDNSKVTATRVCIHYASHIETETADTHRILVTAPTETQAGSYQIVSTEFTNPAFVAQTKTDMYIPALENLDVVMKLPAFLEIIETEAFDGVAAEVIIVPDSCTTIEPRAFLNCKNLLYIRSPARVEIPNDAFTGCPKVVIDQR